ncbi:hypothetical protein BgiBS90_029068 [Biomphalaria glabrata]|nr:hypothetical protein BgiBS90_029068 [Biomphalaria glabrata]
MYKTLTMTKRVYNLHWICKAVLIVSTVNSCICLEIQADYTAYIKNPELASRFIECMMSKDSEACKIFVKKRGGIYYGENVTKITGFEVNVTPIYSCTWMYCQGKCEYPYLLSCQRKLYSFCYDDDGCRFQKLFLIRWLYNSDYLDDERLLENSCSSVCTSYSYRLTTPVTKVTTSFLRTSVIKTNATTSSQYMTTNRTFSTVGNYSTSKSILMYGNSSTTSTSDSENSSNTSKIIIAVIVSVSLIIAALIVIFYCVRKRYRSQNNSGTNIYANDSSLCVENIQSKNNVITSNLHTYGTCEEDDDKSPSIQNEHNKNTNKAYLNISLNINSDEKWKNQKNSKMTSVDEGVYLNTNSDLINKAYARLGDQDKVFKHDYNCLIPEDENNINIQDASRIPEDINASVDKTENTNYTLAQDVMSSTTTYTLANDVLSISDTSTNKYTLAKDAISIADTSTNTYSLANDVDDTSTNKYTLNKDDMSIADTSTNPYTLAKIVKT